MATTLTINKLTTGIGWIYDSAQTFGDNINSNSFVWSNTLSQGTGAGNASKLYVIYDTTGIAASSSTTLDLSNLTDMFGNTLNLSRVMAMYFEVVTTTAGADLVVGNAAATQWAGASQFIQGATDTFTVPAGGTALFARKDATGWVVDGTHKSLKLTNASGSVALLYKLVIIS